MTGKIIETGVSDQLLSSPTASVEYEQWQLEWSTDRQSLHHGKPPIDYNISLILRCIPKAGITHETGDLWVTVGLTLYSGKPNEGEIIFDIPSNKIQPIRLTKQAHYQCGLILNPTTPWDYGDPVLASINNSYRSSPYPHSISLSRFDTCISAKVVIVNVGHPLNDSLRDDFGALLNKSRFCDITLVASYKKGESSSAPVEFPAHKVILAARSPVFATMFEHDMQERSNSKVEIDDVRPDVLRVMLAYIYTGRVSNISDVADDLLYASDKYQLDRLKILCEEQLSKNLKVENAARVIQLAHMHNASLLKKSTLQFISSHGAEVRATKEWKEVRQCPEILDELLGVAFDN